MTAHEIKNTINYLETARDNFNYRRASPYIIYLSKNRTEKFKKALNEKSKSTESIL